MMASGLGHQARKAADEVGTPAHDRIEATLCATFRGEPLRTDAGQTPQEDCVAAACASWTGWLGGMFLAAPGRAKRRELANTGPDTIEGSIWSSDGVAGKIDCIWPDTDGARWVLDWKTSSEPDGSLFRRLLPKYRVQVAGYLVDAEERDDDTMAGGGLVVLPSSAHGGRELAVEHLWTREQLEPEIAMQRHYRALFWLRADQARARGDATLAGYDLANLRPTPERYRTRARVRGWT